MWLTAQEIAALTGGAVSGDSAARVTGVAPLDRATPDHLSFIADRRYLGHVASCRAGILLVAPEFAAVESHAAATIVVGRPYDALVPLLPRFYPEAEPDPGVHRTAIVDPTAVIDVTASIGPYAVIGAAAQVGARSVIGAHCVVAPGVSIGADTRLVSHVSCYGGAVIGDRVTLHAGVRIASDGFGYAFRESAHQKLMHVGRCIIHDDVEIGANSCVDRGSIDDTIIGAGTKIDNLVHVAHNVRIGRLCLLMAQVGVAGSSRVGDGAILAGQVGVAGHLTVGAQARLAAQAGVISDVPAGETWSGYPARPHRDAMRASAALFKLPALLKRIERLLDGER